MALPLPLIVTLTTPLGPVVLTGFESIDIDTDLFVPSGQANLSGPAVQLGAPIPWPVVKEASLATVTLGPLPIFTGTALVKTKNAKTNAIAIELADAARVLVDCAPPLPWSRPAGTLAAFAAELAGQFAVPIAPGASPAVPRTDAITANATQSVWAILEPLCKEAQAWMWADELGFVHVESLATYYAKPPVAQIAALPPGPQAALNNVLDYTLRDDANARYSHIVAKGNGAMRAQHGNAATGLLAAPAIGMAVDPLFTARGIYRPLVVEDGSARNIAQAQARAIREAALRAVEGEKIEVDVMDWTTATGTPWAVTQMVLVNFPADLVMGPYMIAGRRFMADKTNGRRTRLTLVKPGVM